MDDAVTVIAQHADYITKGVRRCTGCDWQDGGMVASVSRLSFARHVLDQLWVMDPSYGPLRPATTEETP